MSPRGTSTVTDFLAESRWTTRPSRYEIALLVSLVLVLVWSGIAPHDRFTWFLEVAPVLIGGADPDLRLTRGFRLTRLIYTLLWIHADHPDGRREVHLRRGAARLLDPGRVRLRAEPLRPDRALRPGVRAGDAGARDAHPDARRCAGSRWLPFLVVCFCLAFSAFYELIEFWTALADAARRATDFLGTQGDVWDTQWDMQMALIGAVTALVLLSRVQDRELGGWRREGEGSDRER